MLKKLEEIREQKARDNQRGFTIIEVMIVLAIAGLILLIVFLAVPALQRNSRNTQRKTDVANTASEIANFESNNAGKLPTAASDFTGNVKYGYYTAADVSFTAALPSPVPAAPGVDSAVVYGKAKCSGNAPVAGTQRQAAIYYQVESSSGGTPQCQDI